MPYYVGASGGDLFNAVALQGVAGTPAPLIYPFNALSRFDFPAASFSAVQTLATTYSSKNYRMGVVSGKNKLLFAVYGGGGNNVSCEYDITNNVFSAATISGTTLTAAAFTDKNALTLGQSSVSTNMGLYNFSNKTWEINVNNEITWGNGQAGNGFFSLVAGDIIFAIGQQTSSTTNLNQFVSINQNDLFSGVNSVKNPGWVSPWKILGNIPFTINEGSGYSICYDVVTGMVYAVEKTNLELWTYDIASDTWTDTGNTLPFLNTTYGPFYTDKCINGWVMGNFNSSNSTADAKFLNLENFSENITITPFESHTGANQPYILACDENMNAYFGYSNGSICKLSLAYFLKTPV